MIHRKIFATSFKVLLNYVTKITIMLPRYKHLPLPLSLFFFFRYVFFSKPDDEAADGSGDDISALNPMQDHRAIEIWKWKLRMSALL